MFLTIAILFGSILALLFGSSATLECAERIGKRLGLSPMVIGIFFIGFGTSLPELIVSHIAAFGGSVDISLGNVVGSNISNIAFILGLCSLVQRIPVSKSEQLKQMIYHILVTVLFVLVSYFYPKTSLFSAVLYIGFFSYYLNDVFLEKGKEKQQPDSQEEKINFVSNSIILILGFLLMFLGGKYLVASATDVARYFHVSEYVISVIVLALGTSAPELFTALLAIYRKKDVDLIVGNIMGSNVFNLALVWGSINFYKLDYSHIDLKFEFLALGVLSIYLLLLSVMKKPLRMTSGLLFLVIYGLCVERWLGK